jgi:hypothetical protein
MNFLQLSDITSGKNIPIVYDYTFLKKAHANEQFLINLDPDSCLQELDLTTANIRIIKR